MLKFDVGEKNVWTLKSAPSLKFENLDLSTDFGKILNDTSSYEFKLKMYVKINIIANGGTRLPPPTLPLPKIKKILTYPNDNFLNKDHESMVAIFFLIHDRDSIYFLTIDW